MVLKVHEDRLREAVDRKGLQFFYCSDECTKRKKNARFKILAHSLLLHILHRKLFTFKEKCGNMLKE